MERDIKITEGVKCLETIQKQINDRKVYLSNAHCQINELQHAPLAEAETTDDESEDETLNGAETCDELSSDEVIISRAATKHKSSSLPPNEIYAVGKRSHRDHSLPHQKSRTLYVQPFPLKKGQHLSRNGSSHDDDGLTAYVQSLGHDLFVYSDYLQVTCCTCSGYLWKLCSKSENKWKKRKLSV